MNKPLYLGMPILDISNDAEKQFDTSNYDKNDKRPLSIGKNKKKDQVFLKMNQDEK